MGIKVSLKNSISGNKDGMKFGAETESEISRKTREADHVVSDSQELLLKAQKDAELAKAVARQAISQAFKQSEASVKRAETFARAFDDALQSSVGQVRHEDREYRAALLDNASAESGLAKTSLEHDQHPLHAISDITETFFANNTIDTETRKDFYDLIIRPSHQLRELVDDLVNQQARERIKKPSRKRSRTE